MPIRSVTLPPVHDSAGSSRADPLLVHDGDRQDGLFLGLALSGGGSRAAVFGAAVMRELQALSLLERVDVLSAVSGGALPASLYALDGRKGIQWDDTITARLAQDFQGEVLAHVFNPLHWPRYWFTSFTRGDALAEVWDASLLHGATYQDVVGRRPQLLLNATDAVTGEPFVFSETDMARRGWSLPDLPLAQAVYASAAYPDTLPPMRIGPSEPTRTGLSDQRTVMLYDGGVADNLGVTTVLSLLEQADRVRGLSDQFPDGCLVISVDATPRVTEDPRRPLSAAAGLLRNHRRQVLQRVGISAAEQDRVAVGTFSPGPSGTPCTFWHVALRQLPDDEPLGRRVTRIPTNLRMDPADRDALESAARFLVERGWLRMRHLVEQFAQIR